MGNRMPRNCQRIWIGLCGILIAAAVDAQDVTGDLNTNIGAGASVDSNNTSNTSSTTYNGSQGMLSNPVPTAMAPTVMGGGGNDSCLIPETRGLQVSLFGYSRGNMQQDDQCNRRKDARLMGAPQAVGGLGLQVSGISVMCQSERVFRAMALSATPCPIMEISTGRLLIGRDAFEKYRSAPHLYVLGYAQDKVFWDALLMIGKDLPDVQEDSSGPSLSARFRRGSGSNNDEPEGGGGADRGAAKSGE